VIPHLTEIALSGDCHVLRRPELRPWRTKSDRRMKKSAALPAPHPVDEILAIPRNTQVLDSARGDENARRREGYLRSTNPTLVPITDQMRSGSTHSEKTQNMELFRFLWIDFDE
jgi:hypothetical protein